MHEAARTRVGRWTEVEHGCVFRDKVNPVTLAAAAVFSTARVSKIYANRRIIAYFAYGHKDSK